MLEKAYAKLYRGYSRIIGGLVHETLVELTGGATEEIRIDAFSGLDLYNGGLWSKLLTYRQEGYLMSCGNSRGSSSRYN